MRNPYLTKARASFKIWSASRPDSCGQCAKAPVRGKSGLHRARITANGRRGRPQGKCNREIPPVLQVRVERRGKSSPASGEPDGPANPIRSNTVERHMRRPGASCGGGIERARQRGAKIDGCSRQNPAYRPGRNLLTKNTPRRRCVFLYAKLPRLNLVLLDERFFLLPKPL